MHPEEAARLSLGPFILDGATRRVMVAGRRVRLTALEFRLLHTLLGRHGDAQTRTDLLQLVWRAQPDIRTRTVDMHVQRLRAKLGKAGAWIETVRGVGYRVRPPEASR